MVIAYSLKKFEADHAKFSYDLITVLYKGRQQNYAAKEVLYVLINLNRQLYLI
jgi:hypothetical protein